MKYFVISLCIDTCLFNYKCGSMKDAYYAVTEASIALDESVDLDKVMTVLVHMNEGQIKSSRHGNIIITIREGEV